MVSFGKKVFKYFIDYEDGKKIRPLSVLCPKISRYKRDFAETKFILFLIKDNILLEKYNEILKKSAIASKKDLIVNPNTMKNTKIKSFDGKINTNFHIDKITKEGY